MPQGSDLSRELSPAVKRAAELDALGVPVHEIAEQVGLTRQSISHYRNNDPRYMELRNQHLENQLRGIAELVHSAREDSLKLFRKMLNRLEESVDAEIEGVPHYPTRLAAIKLFFENPAIRQAFKDVFTDPETPTQQTNVLVLIKSADDDVIEGTIVKEETDG